MSGLIPRAPTPLDTEPAHPSLGQRELDAEERRRLARVKAASWRARELAADVFGGVAESALSTRPGVAAPQGLLQLDVPFDDLDRHRDREDRFLAAVHADPLLSGVPLVYVIGPG